MHYFVFSEKDATLYQATGSQNTGMDEILEVRKDISPTGNTINVSRILIEFDLTRITRDINRGIIKKPKYFLNLFEANSTNLNTTQSLYAYPVSGSWTMGGGRLDDNPITTEGCSWNFRDGKATSRLWLPPVTASGGNWFTGSGFEASASVTHKTTDIRMAVTDIVNKWVSGSITNNGFIVKRSGSLGLVTTGSNDDEGNTKRFGNLSFFSSDTHTKYPPSLEVEWDDSVWTTGSLSALSSTEIEDLVIYMKGLRPEYKEKSRVKFRVVGRDRFPEKTFATTPSTLTVKYLPSGSRTGDGAFYSIQDAETEDVIVPFGSGSKLSCDSNGNFFNLDLDGYQPERFYSLLFKVVSGSGTTQVTEQYFDEGFTFKVTI